jgi:DNA-binding transcriptional ArsR family regulator
MAPRPLTHNPAAKVFQALACDMRLRILNAVEAGHTSTTRVAAALDAPSSTVSKATDPLVRAGLLAKVPRQPGDDRDCLYVLFVTPLARDLISRVLQEREVLDALANRERQVAA